MSHCDALYRAIATTLIRPLLTGPIMQHPAECKTSDTTNTSILTECIVLLPNFKVLIDGFHEIASGS